MERNADVLNSSLRARKNQASLADGSLFKLSSLNIPHFTLPFDQIGPHYCALLPRNFHF